MLRVVLTLIFAITVMACGTDDDTGSSSDAPAVVVTSTILGDIVGEVVGDAAEVEVLFPLGADPHEFAVSARQAEAMAEADLLVVNGTGFEAGLDDAIEAAADGGVEVFTVTDHVDLLDDDPHVWTDPSRLVPAVEALGERLVAIGVDDVQERAAAYLAELESLDAELESLLTELPAERRVLVTNHEVLGYFADRYDFEVIGAVIPSLTTGAEASAADIEDLATLIEDTGVPAIFGETSSPSDVAEVLAESVGAAVQVVELFTESLGDEGSGAESYLEMMRTDARLILEALQ